MYKKSDARAELLFCSLNLLLFCHSRCRRRRSRKVPVNRIGEEVGRGQTKTKTKTTAHDEPKNV